MGTNTYRSTLERLMRERARMEDDKAAKQKKIADLIKEIDDAQRSMTRTSSESSRRSYQRRIEAKQKDLATTQKALAAIESKLTSKVADINRTLKALGQAEERERRNRDSADKDRRRTEQRHADAMTRAAREQARLHDQIARNPLVIDLKRLPTKITVLFLAANPMDQNQLRLDEEHRTIVEKLRASEHRDAIEFRARWAVRPGDLQQALNELQPHIIHFSGHGDQDEILFQNADGSTKPVTKGAIAATLSTTADNVRVVIFNSCFSADQAQAVTKHVDVAIGMNGSIGDDAARIFAGQFYSAIGFGRSVRNAFDQAVNELRLHGIPEDDIPEIHVREGIDPDSIVLVRPAEW